jgi:hypothetical protein
VAEAAKVATNSVLGSTSLMSLNSPACLMPSTRTDDILCNSSRKRAEMTSEILCTTTESSGVDAGGRALPGPEAASLDVV